MFICASVYVYMCLLVCLHVSVCLCVIVDGVYVCVTIRLRIHLCVSACVHLQMWSMPWADPQRERLTGPCGHASCPLGSTVSS